MLRISVLYILVIVSFIFIGCGTIGVSKRDTSDPNEKYRFKCRIYEIKINEHSIWDIQAEFIVSDEKKILHQPELVN